jgi:hypothetical protein
LELLSQGGGSAVTFSNAPFSVDTAGNVTVPTTISVPTPTIAAHAATKAYVDALTATNVSYIGTASGTNNYTVTLTPTPPSLASLTNIPIYIKFTNANTNVSTLNANSFGAVPLSGGNYNAGKYYSFLYDGSKFQNLERVSAIAKGTAQAVTGTTLTNDNTLFMPVAINETWTFHLTARLSTTNTATGLKYTFTAPTGATGAFSNTTNTIATTANFGSALTPNFSGNSPGYMQIVGDIETDGTHTGLLQFQFASDTAGVTVNLPSPGVNGNAYLVAVRVSP